MHTGFHVTFRAGSGGEGMHTASMSCLPTHGSGLPAAHPAGRAQPCPTPQQHCSREFTDTKGRPVVLQCMGVKGSLAAGHLAASYGWAGRGWRSVGSCSAGEGVEGGEGAAQPCCLVQLVLVELWMKPLLVDLARTMWLFRGSAVSQ